METSKVITAYDADGNAYRLLFQFKYAQMKTSVITHTFPSGGTITCEDGRPVDYISKGKYKIHPHAVILTNPTVKNEAIFVTSDDPDAP